MALTFRPPRTRDPEEIRRILEEWASRLNLIESAINFSTMLVIAGISPQSSVSPSAEGLFVGSNYIGRYSGTEWETYIGASQLKVDSDHYIIGNGTTIQMVGVDVSGGNAVVFDTEDGRMEQSDGTAIDLDDLAESSTRKFAAESGADVTGDHSADIDIDSVSESATRKFASESGADITGDHAGDIDLADLNEKNTSSLDQITDYKLVSDNEKTGAGRAYQAIDENIRFTGKLGFSTADVGDPPSASDIGTALGAPATVGSGAIGVIDDNNAHTDVWLCVSDGTNWWYAAMTKAT